MDKEYRKVIISIIIIVVIVVGIGVFWRYKQETKFSPLEKNIISFLETYYLSEASQIELNNAVGILKENPESVSALINIASIRGKVSDTDGALEFYLKALEIQPTNVVVLNNLAYIYNHEKKEYGKSAEMYLRSTKSAPEQISAYQSLMYIYQRRIPEKHPEMEQILLTAIEKNTDATGYAPADFYLMLAVFYRETENMDKAIEYFEIAMELSPDNESIKIEIERLKELKHN